MQTKTKNDSGNETSALLQQPRPGLIPNEEDVMAEYLRLGYVKTKKEGEMLARFFSTVRVPTGLTERQVQICLQKLPLREYLRHQTIDVRGLMHDVNRVGRSLPSELWLSEPMTEERFEAGMKKLNDEAIALLAQENIYGQGKFLCTDDMYIKWLTAPFMEPEQED
jgi:hypothetical protein